jgi:chromate transporter
MSDSQKAVLPFSEAVRVWVRVALHSFGGPAGQIAVMHKILVEEKKWISESRFLHALNYCMLLPGPEAQQLATYIGWLLHKTKGGLVAGLLFILPGFISILLLSILYVYFQDVTLVQGIFFGIKPAVLAIVVGAVIKIGKKALKNSLMYVIAAGAFLCIFFLQIDFPYIVIAAALIGLLGGYLLPDYFHVIKGHDAANATNGSDDRYLHDVRPSFTHFVKTAFIYLFIWVIPFFLILAFAWDDVFLKEASFFSKTAVVTFGGAYSVLAYMAQKAVETYGWLKPGEMLDGLGMAETTPGPLIQVVQFVGFMGAFRLATTMDPLMAGILGSIIVTWVTFAPCFLFIFAGAPYIEYLRGNKHLTAALSGITAAVVGVILNLGIWFSVNTLFTRVTDFNSGIISFSMPEVSSVHWGMLAVALLAFLLYFKFKWSMMKTILACVVVGVGIQFWMQHLG